MLLHILDSTTQTDTKANEGDNEHSEINIGIKVIALQVTNVYSTIQNKSDKITPIGKSTSKENVQKNTEMYLDT